MGARSWELRAGDVDLAGGGWQLAGSAGRSALCWAILTAILAPVVAVVAGLLYVVGL